MGEVNSTLLASFVGRNDIQTAIRSISDRVGISTKEIEIFLVEGGTEYIVVYNVAADKANLKFDAIWKDTIALHRKKETNTLFSLNALNSLISSKIGKVNTKYKIDWTEYTNRLLILRRKRLVILNIEKVEIIV